MSKDIEDFAGLRVVSLESRLSGSMSEMISRQAGVPIEAPSLREVPLTENPAIPHFFQALDFGAFELTLFETGVGVRYLTEASKLVNDRFWPGSLAKTVVIARGPKPAAALRQLGVKIGHQVPEPNTWRETLALLDAYFAMAGRTIAVQEYGKPSDELIAGLDERGAKLTRVPVYRWALPEDTQPLRSAIRAIASREVDAVLFTSGQQVIHLLQIAEEEGQTQAVQEALSSSIIIGSIGPTTSAILREHHLPVDIEPVHPKMGHLVNALAQGWRKVVKKGDKP